MLLQKISGTNEQGQCAMLKKKLSIVNNLESYIESEGRELPIHVDYLSYGVLTSACLSTGGQTSGTNKQGQSAMLIHNIRVYKWCCK